MALGTNISAGQGETYYQKDDYYLSVDGDRKHQLAWGGTLAKELKLTGPVSPEAWKQALNGNFGQGIKINGGSMKDKDGNTVRRAGTDFELSAPKSLSAQVLVFGDEKLLLSHEKAVDAVSKFLESKIGSRNGKAGKDWTTTGVGLYGRVRHLTNRNLDPHLHDHLVFLNITKDPKTGKYKAMTNDLMMRYQRLAQEVYHAVLSMELRKNGYEIYTDKYGVPQIAGYSRESLESFSTRNKDIRDFLKEKHGIDQTTMSAEERRVNIEKGITAWRKTRTSKKNYDPEVVKEKWQSTADSVGLRKVEPLHVNTRKQNVAQVAKDALVHALEHFTEREFVVSEVELLRKSLQECRGTATFDDVEKVYNEFVSSGEIVKKDNGKSGVLLTTKEAIRLEKSILSLEKTGRQSVEPILFLSQAEKHVTKQEEKIGKKLDDQQRSAALTVLSTENQIVGINGLAGVGKTTMLLPIISILKEQGFSVIGLAPQHSAVDALKEAGIGEAKTLQSWLVDRNATKELSEKTVIVIDEAGLTNARDMLDALERATIANARVVLVGDVNQYLSVGAGSPFGILQKNGMETAFVGTMKRQANAEKFYQEATKVSVTDPGQAIKILNENNAIIEIMDEKQQIDKLAELYVNSPSSAQETLLLTGTHKVKEAVNKSVRESLGLAEKGKEVTTFKELDATKAEMKKATTYTEGQAVRFETRIEGRSASTIGIVTSSDPFLNTVSLKFFDGAEKTYALDKIMKKEKQSWTLGRVEKKEFSVGERVRFTDSSLKKEQQIIRGLRGEIKNIDDKGNMTIKLDGGREIVLEADVKKPLPVDYGYAQTGHSAQGLGKETVILHADPDSLTTSQRSFYTNITRMKENLLVVTSDAKSLEASVSRQSEKSSALDVEKSEKTEEKAQEKAEEKTQEKKIAEKTEKKGISLIQSLIARRPTT